MYWHLVTPFNFCGWILMNVIRSNKRRGPLQLIISHSHLHMKSRWSRVLKEPSFYIRQRYFDKRYDSVTCLGSRFPRRNEIMFELYFDRMHSAWSRKSHLLRCPAGFLLWQFTRLFHSLLHLVQSAQSLGRYTKRRHCSNHIHDIVDFVDLFFRHIPWR